MCHAAKLHSVNAREPLAVHVANDLAALVCWRSLERDSLTAVLDLFKPPLDSKVEEDILKLFDWLRNDLQECNSAR